MRKFHSCLFLLHIFNISISFCLCFNLHTFNCSSLQFTNSAFYSLIVVKARLSDLYVFMGLSDIQRLWKKWFFPAFLIVLSKNVYCKAIHSTRSRSYAYISAEKDDSQNFPWLVLISYSLWPTAFLWFSISGTCLIHRTFFSKCLTKFFPMNGSRLSIGPDI